MMRILIFFIALCAIEARAQNVYVTNSSGHPVPVNIVPNSTVTSAVTVSKSTALEASRVIKASSGSLIYLGVHNTGAAAISIMLINATSLPANGPVSLLYPPIRVPAGGDMTFSPPFAIAATTGIVVAGSTTDTFSLTVGTAVLEIYALYQ